MRRLTIVLRHGFSGESVEVQVDSRQVYRRDGVRTRFQIDRADAREVMLEESPRAVGVRVSIGAASAELQVDPSTTPTLTVDWRDGRVCLAPGADVHDA